MNFSASCQIPSVRRAVLGVCLAMLAIGWASVLSAREDFKPKPRALVTGSRLFVAQGDGLITTTSGEGGTLVAYKSTGRETGDTTDFESIVFRDEQLYVVDADLGYLDAISLTSGAINRIVRLDYNKAPKALAIDAAGNFFVSMGIGSSILKISPDGQTISTFVNLPYFETEISKLLFDKDGNLLATYTDGHVIYKITPAGVLSTFVKFNTGPYAYPQGMAYGPNGDLFVVDYYYGAIYEVTANGSFTTYLPPGTLDRPLDLAFDASGTLFVADFYSVDQVAPDGTRTTYALRTGDFINRPQFMVIVPDSPKYLLPVTPQFTSVRRLANGHCILQAIGTPNLTYYLLASPSLSPAKFTTISTITTDATGAMQYDDDGAAYRSQRFYRLGDP